MSAVDPNESIRSARRQRTWSNAVRDRFEIGMFRLLRRLPLRWAAAPGRWLTRRELQSNRPWVAEHARANLQRLRPHDTAEEREMAVARFLDHLAAFVGEVPTIGRQSSAGRVRIEGAENVLSAYRTGGVVLMGLHLGNWEILSEAVRQLGLQASTFYEEAETEVQTRILREIRQDVGVDLLEANATGLRRAMRELVDGRVICLFADHLRGGRIMAPLLGRPPEKEGNLAIIARLARKARVPVVPAYVLREDDGRFTVRWMPTVRFSDDCSDPLADVLMLNRLIEPPILANLDQWFFLDDGLN
ncbi:lysophospholipid acyltransferase family protein [Roseococcus pinisoli]|uniref:Lysophospholipid acyltransferase family protein n=1 Tax=Roseococcus pinisoli TaxID=2835040 RepID=A0ABS5QIB5_9PROT|nr:lysophospholipid acyltransferase family protein [Roseococcus pinisoli]MBS7813381.1 lysophospholipid acyltransferase family protein [Roseococcus pinisoli]